MIARLIFAVVLLTGVYRASGLPEDGSPFAVSAEVRGERVCVVVKIPPGHLIYAESVKVRAQPADLLGAPELPEPVKVNDAVTGHEEEVYKDDFEILLPIRKWGGRVQLTVGYQGCRGDMCFLPELATLDVHLKGPGEEGGAGGGSQPRERPQALKDRHIGWREKAERFEIVARDSGYCNAADFLKFLDTGMEGGGGSGHGSLPRGIVGILLVLVGGLALNMTPCVLPMIPINLAIIGAGAIGGGRKRGFMLGLIYGAGMAGAYGALGIVVVMTGATFGALNASPWFNAAIAVVFVILALAMFDVVHIDLTRFQSSIAGGARDGGRRGFAFVFMLGAAAALLAGACVAPVVIAVLVWSGALYSEGIRWGLLLPFLLGIGMALPWPVVGAGLTLLPKPGRWMIWVRNAFGVLILGLALYYGHTAYTIFLAQSRAGAGTPVEEVRRLERGLERSLRTDSPVLIDFGAGWCKSCMLMDRTTFRDRRVAARLKKMTVIKYHAEDPSETLTRQVLDYFQVKGLPTYLLLVPKRGDK